MNTNADEFFPKKSPAGRILLPKPGDHVYVPSSITPHHIGGLATVEDVRGTGPDIRKIVTVEEHPLRNFVWKELRALQYDLWKEHGTQRAREPTPEEEAALLFKLEQERRAKEAFKEAQAAVEAAAEAARWAPRTLTVMNGGLLDPPVWCDHERARNWAAIVEADPMKPGGLQRFWFLRGMGIFKYIVPKELGVHDVVEFGADYVTGGGWRKPERWIGIVTEVTSSGIVLEPCKNATHALTLLVERKVSKA
jgi:hypothetical protein